MATNPSQAKHWSGTGQLRGGRWGIWFFITALRVLGLHVTYALLLPVVAYQGPATAGIITGSILIETVFALPGIGRHFVDAALNRDYPLALGITLLYGGILILFNILTDLVRGHG